MIVRYCAASREAGEKNNGLWIVAAKREAGEKNNGLWIVAARSGSAIVDCCREAAPDCSGVWIVGMQTNLRPGPKAMRPTASARFKH